MFLGWVSWAMSTSGKSKSICLLSYIFDCNKMRPSFHIPKRKVKIALGVFWDWGGILGVPCFLVMPQSCLAFALAVKLLSKEVVVSSYTYIHTLLVILFLFKHKKGINIFLILVLVRNTVHVNFGDIL